MEWQTSSTRRRRVVAGDVVETWDYLDARVMRGRTPERKEKSERTKRPDSIYRAKRMIRWLVSANAKRPTAYFYTVTFSKNVTSYAEAVIVWEKFRRILKKEFPQIAYVVVPELQKRGAWHFHAAIFNAPSVAELQKTYGKRQTNDGGQAYAWKWRFTVMWSQANGHDADSGEVDRAEIQPVKDHVRLSRYITKYITKETGDRVPSDKRMFFSGGKELMKPQIEKVQAYRMGEQSVEYLNNRGKAIRYRSVEIAKNLLPDPSGSRVTVAFSRKDKYNGRVTYHRFESST